MPDFAHGKSFAAVCWRSNIWNKRLEGSQYYYNDFKHETKKENNTHFQSEVW